MYSVKITFLSPFHKFSGDREFTVELKEEEDTFGDLIKKLVEKFGTEFKETILDENNQVEDWISVMQNGRNIGSKPNSGYSEMLEKDDEFIFCAFISGG